MHPFREAIYLQSVKWVLPFVLVFLIVSNTFGSPVISQDYLIDLWTSDDGLPDTSVGAIAQTPDGYLWIGTYNGLARFDGVRFVNLDPFNTPELKQARVDRLFVDAQGTLWINTHDGSMTTLSHGVFAYQRHVGNVTAIFSHKNQVFFALSSGQIVCRTEDSRGNAQWQSIRLAGTTSGNLIHQDSAGIIWYATRDGALERIIGTNSAPVSNQAYLNGEPVNFLTTDDYGRIWVGTQKRLLLWQGDHFEDHTPTNGEREVNVDFIACSTTNGCWIIADGKVRRCMNRRWVNEADSWQDLTNVNTTFLASYEDVDGGVWLRDYGLGLFHAKPDGATQTISAADGLPDNRIRCWFQDHEGNIWLGVDHGGLVRLRKRNFHVLGASEGLSIPAISTVCEDSNSNLWIGTFGGGLNRWYNGALTRYDLPEGGYRGNFLSVYPDGQGRLWISAGREDLFSFYQGKFSPPSRPTLFHGTKVILVDHRGRIWVGRQNDLECVSNNVLTRFTEQSGFDQKDIRALAEDRQGNIWIGSGEGVLYKFTNGKFSSYQINDSLRKQPIWSLLPEADGTLWLGTFRGGLLRFKDGKFTRYTMQDGLPSDVICQILDDRLGKLWLGSYKGIFSVSKSSFQDYDEGKIGSLPCVSYGLYDGLPTLECSSGYQPSCWQSHDGTLWFATVKGLVSVNPSAMSVNQLPPPVTIEEILIDGKLLTNLTGTTLQIPPGKHQLDFHYTALSFTAPDKVQFRYQLKGLDDQWVEADEKRSAHYGSLQPGEYSFQVIACNNDDVWNLTGASMNITVLPHYWETWWFECLIGLFIIGTIFGVVRFITARNFQRRLEQLKQQQAIEHERQRIAKDIHDDLGAGLTQIILQSAQAQRQPQGQAQRHLTQISIRARELVSAMDEIVWAVNPENDTLDGLITYAGKFVQEYVTQAGLRCRLDLPTELPSLVLSAEVRHNLFLAIKEALNNAIKHAHAAEVFFQLKVQPSSFSVIIKDDGCGFIPNTAVAPPPDLNRVSSGHGLGNLTQRLEGIGGRCQIRTQPDKGTEVELIVMINQKAALLNAMAGKLSEEKLNH
jgi:signal transduction histidine kinase/ligand-binding sensor domain-containing protein